MKLVRSHSETLAVAIFLIFSAIYATLFGFLSPDSWDYVRLTESLVAGNLCEINGKYFAIFPCGYAIALALSSFSQDPSTIIIISKFTNAGLLLASFLCFKQLFSQRQFLAALIIVAPSTISISHYTWSENLFLFATALSLWQVHRLAHLQSYISQVVLLIALLVGISSRYFFGPFAALIWLSTFVIYGTETAKRTLPVFIISGFAFVFYYLLNSELTVYGTGMQRISAPESLLYLIIRFFWAVLYKELPALILFLFFFYLITKKMNEIKIPSINSIWFKKGELLVLAAGLSFLLLSFVFRIIVQFDLYGFRTLGYGLTFLVVATYALITISKKCVKYTFLITIIFSFISFGIAIRGHLKELAIDILGNNYTYQSVSLRINQYKKLSNVKDFDNVVSFYIPKVGKFISSNSQYYYGERTRLITPHIAPYRIPDSLDSFSKKVELAEGTCAIDFTVFQNEEEFIQHMKTSDDIDILFDTKLNRPVRVKAPRFDKELADFFIRHYQNQKLIECSILFEKQ